MRFEKGNAGRRKGSLNRRTLLQQETLELLAGGDRQLPTRYERLKRLLLDPDARVRLECERLLIYFDWQRPPVQSKDVAEACTIEETLQEVWRQERALVAGRPGSEKIKAQLEGPQVDAFPAFDLTSDKGADYLPKATDIDAWNPGWPIPG